jgi:rSAM/selenodomain-associated transferase 2
MRQGDPWAAAKAHPNFAARGLSTVAPVGWQFVAAPREGEEALLSLVIPTLDAADALAETLARLAPELAGIEVVVADGGSTDATRAVAERHGARVISAPRGRGRQLAAGAAAATGDWLLFLHADTRPAPGWRAVVDRFMADPANAERAAAFRFTLDDDDPRARRVERGAAWRARVLGLAYGDQGLLLSRKFYDALGGYPPYKLMEDVAMIRRVGKRRLVLLDHGAPTSAARYRRDGWTVRPARNAALLTLYFLGVPTSWLARLYG